MLTFSRTVAVPSISTPGVTITVRRLSKVERADIELQESALLDPQRSRRARELMAGQKWPKGEDGQERIGHKPDAMTAEAWSEYLQIDQQTAVEIARYSIPLIVRAGLVSLDGIQYAEGKAATADDLIQSGPDDLLTEVEALIRANMGLTAEQAKNWRRPSISSEAERPVQIDSIAPSASDQKSTDTSVAE